MFPAFPKKGPMFPDVTVSETVWTLQRFKYVFNLIV